MITRLKEFFIRNGITDSYFSNVKTLNSLVVKQIKDNQSLSGRIKVLEEQQELMHNFLCEINKYLVKYSDKVEMYEKYKYYLTKGVFEMKKEDSKKEEKEKKEMPKAKKHVGKMKDSNKCKGMK